MRSGTLAKMEYLQLAPGSLFANRFVIKHAAGSGGMGTVYHATDRFSGGAVALKLLHADSTGSGEAERFAREALLLSELHHPGIVAHIAHGQTPGGQRFLAMEWLDGHDLCERLSRGPLPVRDCLRLLGQVADALAVAHQRGIIHRDLKPSNLFLCGGDIARVKILDFGIARRTATSQAMTRTGMVIGTPEYMAPEQARGSRDLTPAADLFSLGCVLYECLTGQPPFVADHVAAVLVKILLEEPVPIADRRPGVPAVLATILDRLLSKEPAQRLADAAALRAELSRLGEIPEPVMAATVASPRPKAETFAEQEQSLFSIVLAAPGEQDIGLEVTQPGSDVHLAALDKQALLQALAALGGTPAFLADGTLVVTVPPLGSAQDQATVAARAALFVKERWSQAVVSMATGRGAVRGRIAGGEVVELAARSLKSGNRPPLERPMTGVLIDPLSAKLLAGRFVQMPLPDGAMLLHEDHDEEADRPLLGKPTPCVGRDAELGSLEGLLTRCIEETESTAVLVTAAPGIGKSRVRHEFLRRVEKREKPVTVLLARGDLMSAGAPYGIISGAIRRLCGLHNQTGPDEQRQLLTARIGRHIPEADRVRVVSFIGELCNLPFSDDVSPVLYAARQDPMIMQDCLGRAAIDWLRAECTAAPLLLVFDDLQWGDALTIALIDEALAVLRDAPLFVLAFARPEVHGIFPKLWARHRLQESALKPLSKKACERLFHQLLGKSVPADAVARAIEQSGGNALFLEEIIRAIAEGNDGARSATVVAMLQARIGRLPAGPRRAVRAAAIFGQTFWQGGIAALLAAQQTPAESESWLAELVDAELIEPHTGSRRAGEKEYGFRHALIQDAVYSLLLPSDLATGHRMAGEYLEAVGEQDAALIAQHLDRGGIRERALLFYIRAAEHCLERHDMQGVLRHSERGLLCGASGESFGHLRALQAAANMFCKEWRLALDIGMEALGHLSHGSPLWLRTIGHLFLLSGHLQETALMQPLIASHSKVDPAAYDTRPYLQTALFLIYVFSMLGMRAPARVLLSRIQKNGASLAARDLVARGLIYLAESYYAVWMEPDAYQALSSAEQACAAFTQAEDLRNLCLAQRYLGAAQCRLGAVAAAAQTLHDNMRLAERIQDAYHRLMAEYFLMVVLSTDAEHLGEAARLASTLLQKSPDAAPFILGSARWVLAKSCAAHGLLAEAEAYAKEADQLLSTVPSFRYYTLAVLAQILLQAGRVKEAQQVAEQGLTLLENVGGSGWSDMAMRVAAAESRHAVGDLQGARAILQAGLSRLAFAAERIPDAELRQCFLTRVPENARAFQLEHSWAGR